MTLDLRTIVVMLMLSAVLMALTLAFGLRSASAGFAKWNAGLGMYALAWLLIAARGVLPDVVGVALANALLLGGLCFQLAALLEFDGRRAPRALLFGPALLLFALLVPLRQHYAALTLVSSAFNVCAIVALAVAVLRLGARAGAVRWLMGVVLTVGAIGIAARAADIWRHPDLTTGMFAGSLLHVLAFLILFAITVTSSFAFLVMQQERAEGELRRLAMVDPLTGLYNRRAFLELAARELARSRREGSPSAVLMVDLDHFKRVNDDFGHQAGDRVLAAFGALLGRSLREADVAGRYGGEEFCAVLPGAGLAEAAAIAERVRGAAAQAPLGDLPRITTASIGVALLEPDVGGIEPALARADAALYAAKQAGRNRVECGVTTAPAALRQAA
jgi:diguanylate cyclase (GGDEF)-like protein